LTTPTDLNQGVFSLTFRPYQVLPSLADPYAANFDALIRDSPVGGLQLQVTVKWPDPSAPALAFDLLPASAGQQIGELFPAARPIRQGDTLLELFNHWTTGNALQQLALLDVSSNADQLGVAFELADGDASFAFDNMALSTAGAQTKTFLLPQFQWEPMYNKFNKLVPGVPEGFLFCKTTEGRP
jgi:hypothetical protein